MFVTIVLVCAALTVLGYLVPVILQGYVFEVWAYNDWFPPGDVDDGVKHVEQYVRQAVDLIRTVLNVTF